MWNDVCLRLNCSKDTPVKILMPVDLLDKNHKKVVEELKVVTKLVVVMPDCTNCGIWQLLDFFTVKKYFYRAEAQLLGRAGWTHWALLIDWTKRKKEDDDIMKPGREYSVAELEGRVQRTQAARRRYRRQQLRSHMSGGVALE